MTRKTFADLGVLPNESQFPTRVLCDPGDLAEAHVLRYQVYCLERRLFSSSAYPEGLECDRLDERSVHIGAFHRASGILAGTVRLVLRAGDALPMEAHCHFQKGRSPSERRGNVAEISRLAVSREFRRRRFDDAYGDTSAEAPSRDPERRSGNPAIVLGLYRAIYQESRRRDISHLYAAMEPRLFAIFNRYGICFERVGPMTDYFGKVAPYAASIRALERRLAQHNPRLMAEFRFGLERQEVSTPLVA